MIDSRPLSGEHPLVRALRRELLVADSRLGGGERPGKPALAVACSGGPDSTALAAAAVAADIGPILLLHIDHGLREDSHRDAELVVKLAETLGCRAEVVRVQVDIRAASVEAAARDARYAAFAEATERLRLDWIMTAHTADDQAETVLHRLVRGTGIRGLVGIQRVRPPYLRPWLDVARAEVHAVVAELGLAAVADPMNFDPQRFRTRTRHALIPALAAENPDIVAALCRLAAAAEETDTLVAGLARGALEAASYRDGAFDIGPLAAAPAAVAKRALMLALEERGLPVEGSALDDLYGLALAPTAGTRGLDLAGGRAERVYDRIVLCRSVPGETGETGGPGPDAEWNLEIIGEGGPFRVRTPVPGDRMRPARLKGRSRKLSDLFIDARVPRAARSVARLVVRELDGEIVWAQHLGSAHGANIEVRLTGPDTVAT